MFKHVKSGPMSSPKGRSKQNSGSPTGPAKTLPKNVPTTPKTSKVPKSPKTPKNEASKKRKVADKPAGKNSKQGDPKGKAKGKVGKLPAQKATKSGENFKLQGQGRMMVKFSFARKRGVEDSTKGGPPSKRVRR